MLDLLQALDPAAGEVAVAAPQPGAGYWAGGPSAVLSDGVWWLAYRLRRPVTEGRGFANVVARSTDGVAFEVVATVTSDEMKCASLERPALVTRPDGGWRLYVSCSTYASKHWWVEALDADSPDQLSAAHRTMVLPGDDTVAWKDVVVHRTGDLWRMWACRHPLDGGDDEADRMSSWYATSDDGLDFTFHGEALGPGDGWDRRGARITSALPDGDGWYALYDGRASAAENWVERTGAAQGSAGSLSAVAGPVPATVGIACRYASAVPDEGGVRVYFEATSQTGSHDLRTVYVPRPAGASHSL
jgi:hypothetical protein